MLESLFAGLTLAICLLLLLHMAIGPVRREKLRLRWLAFRHARGLTDWRRLWHSPRQRAAAQREADETIERARRTAEQGEWEGNVYRPKSFDRRSADGSDKRSADRSSKRPPLH